jgi:hypothetical protein
MPKPFIRDAQGNAAFFLYLVSGRIPDLFNRILKKPDIRLIRRYNSSVFKERILNKML